MQIRTDIQVNTAYNSVSLNAKKQENTEINANMNAKQISNAYFMQFKEQTISQSSSNFNAQNAVFENLGFNVPENLMQILQGIDTTSLGYNGTPLDKLSKDEAKELVSDEGFFGVTKTAERIANFVLSGAGDDEDKLRAGREGILRGFKEAEQMWGGKLPEISYQTIQKATDAIDEKLSSLNANVINTTV